MNKSILIAGLFTIMLSGCSQQGSHGIEGNQNNNNQIVNAPNATNITISPEPTNNNSIDDKLKNEQSINKEKTLENNSSQIHPSNQIKLDKTIFVPGEKIKVYFSGAENYSDDAWIGIVPAGVRHGSQMINDQHDLDYKYIRNQIEGSFEFIAPEEPGLYNFRMNNNGAEVAYLPFKVR